MAAKRSTSSTRSSKSSTSSKATAKTKASRPTRRRTPSRDQNAPTGPYAFHEALAICLGGVALMLFLALVSYTPYDLPSWVPFSVSADDEKILSNFIGPLGAITAGWLYFIFGAASYLIPAVLAWWGVQVLTGARPFHTRNYLALIVMVVSAASLIEYQTMFFQDWPERYNLPRSAGGFFGYLSTFLESRGVGTVGACIVTSIAYGVSLIVITGLHPFRFVRMVRDRTQEQVARRHEIAETIADRSRQLIRRRGDDGVEAAAMATRGSSASKAPRKPKASRKTISKEPETEGVPTAVEEMELPLEPALPEPKIIDASQPRRKEDGAPVIDPSVLFGKHRKKKGEKSGAASTGSLITNNGAFDDYELPSFDLLEYGDSVDAAPTDTGRLLEVQKLIVDSLGTFGVEVSPGDITKGPTITRYEVYPKPGLRVSRITTLEADLARATRAERINILAPIPGKDTVGIEIANSDKVLVTLRELFEDDAFCKSKARIPLALGKDVYGRVIVGDLASMPHLLVAGATGSGKSVCINSIIASILYRFTPDELRFIMIDPKVVEMQLYNSLPHMVVPVVTDPKKVILALRWVVNEMERRYAMFAKLGTRNFEGFNGRNKNKEKENASKEAEAPIPKSSPKEALAAHAVKINDDGSGLPDAGIDGETLNVEMPESSRGTSPGIEEEEEFPDTLPYIVVIIDELADLMQTAPADVETAIARIAQKARAAGIHLIVATQTPRADVVTGIIKANIPSRIAFQVSSKIDSRVILDAPGADRLVGKGDMLYLPPGCSQLVRAQGAFVGDEEIHGVVEACSQQADPAFEPGIQETLDGGGESEEEEVSDADEDLLEKCLEVVLQEKKASTSLLQRRLRLGYTRAARMIDILEQRGVIGPGDGAKPREILVDLSEGYD